LDYNFSSWIYFFVLVGFFYGVMDFFYGERYSFDDLSFGA
jgi:hypothetical protein